MQLLQSHLVIDKNCYSYLYFQCLIKTGEYKQSTKALFLEGKCASAYQCLPADQQRATILKRWNAKELTVGLSKKKFSANQLASQLINDMKRASQAFENEVTLIARGYANTSNRLLKQVHKCDLKCTDRFTSNLIFNPAEAMQECQCEMPI